MRNVYSFFPTLVYRNELPGWVKKIEAVVAGKLKNRDAKSKVVQSENLILNQNLEFFNSFILKEAVYALSEQGYDVQKYDFFVSEIWGQMFTPGGLNFPHVHPGCQISGLYFFEVSDEGVEIYLHDPRSNKLMTDLVEVQSKSILASSTQVVLTPPVEGTLLMYNSWLSHNVVNNSAAQNVKFLHFNISCKIKNI